MKGIILSAGQGSRLLPLTRTLPKCLVEVDGRAILGHQLAALHASGIEEAVVVTGYRHAQVAQYLEQPLPIAVNLVFNPFWSVANSIGSVWAAREHLAGPFCLMNGDTIFDAAVIRTARERAADGVSLLVERTGDFALDDMRVRVEDGQVRAVAKTLPADEATHRSLGVILSTGREGAYAHALAEVIGAENGQSCYHHAVVARLAETVGVGAIANEAGVWQEIDRPEDIDHWARVHGEAGRRVAP